MPNPPASFVGREAELRAVGAAMKRGNVVVVCGVGGLGKTSLACKAVSKHLGARLSAAVMVGLRRQPLQQALVEIVRALAQLAERQHADWSAMASEEELITVALDLAEQREAVVVLDDLHHVLPGAEELLLMIARYARRSLWLATSRIEPAGPELAGQIIRLGPLPDKKLTELARLINPGLKSGNVRRNVEAAGGSP
ncbi:MAG TPA: AAA family ATPase, partial [Labilithrix sp.]|nr:AAA family ATPase [Labilithrix sp.]